MAKTHPYFKFYCSEWNDGDITLEDFETQGVFIGLCSLYWSRECNLTKKTVDKKFKNNLKNILTLQEEEIIKILGSGLVKISFLDEQWHGKDRRSSTSKTNGSLGGRPKKPNNLNKPNSEPNSEPNGNLTKPNIDKRIEEKSIEDKKTKEKKECALFSLTLPLFESRGAKHLHQEFCDYWSAINEMTDMPRWKEDPYFKSNMTMKVTGWIDRSKTQAGKNNPVLNHPHQEFLEQWIIKAEPTNAQIEAAKSILLNNYQDLETKYLMKALESNSTANIDTLFKRSKSMQVRTHKDKLAPRMAPKSDLPEEELTIEQIECMAKMTPPEVFEAKYPELLERLENHKKGANK